MPGQVVPHTGQGMEMRSLFSQLIGPPGVVKERPAHTPPKRGVTAFNCPLCHAYAKQEWSIIFRPTGMGPDVIWDFEGSHCSNCGQWLYWFKDKIIVPDVSNAPPINSDLNDDIKRDYEEAAMIASKSPRGAAALLRLCIQKICKQLGEKGNNLNDDVGALVRKGLHAPMQVALDAVRVIGNSAVHPGGMDLRDDQATVAQLFALVNEIANQMITQPRLRKEIYSKLPKGQLDAITRRDDHTPN